MDALTRAELAAYPDETDTERALAAHENDGPRTASRLPPVVDLRAYPGRDRLERAANYLRARFPRSETWSQEALAQLARDLLAQNPVID
jgi:hypothetical protein